MLLLFDRFMNPLLLSGVAFGTYDWVLLGIILFAALIGVIRGFTKQLFDLCGFLVVLIASILLCKVVAKLLPDSSGAIFDKINGFLTDKVTQNGLEELWSAPQNWHSSPELVEQALEAFGLSKIFSFLVTPLTKNLADGAILSETLPQELTGSVNNIICFIVLFIILYIIIFLLKKLLNKAISKISILKLADKLLGMVLGAVLAIFWISVAFSAVNLLSGLVRIPFVTEFFEENLYTTNIGMFILEISEWLLGLIGM